MIKLPCSCSMKFHYLDLGKEKEDYLRELLAKNGEYRKIIHAESGTAYKVPVGFILVHGLKGNELNKHGFEQWPDERRGN